MTVTSVGEGGRRRAPGPARIGRRHGGNASLERSESATVGVEAITVIGLICAWMVAQMLLFGMLSHTRSQAILYGQLREELAEATAPTGGVIVPGNPVALVTIPAIGVQEVVVEGTSAGELLKGPGHLRSSVLPGQAGTSVLLGRARTYGAPFAKISLLHAGHAIQAMTAQGPATYRVDDVRRAGDALPKQLAAGAGRLTLVSGYTGTRLSSLAPHEVVYVDATLITKSYQAPANGLRAVAPSELAMARDTNVMPSLALSLGALAVVLAAGLLARDRIPDAVVWIVGAPTTIALAWASGDNLMHLLPNLF